MTSRIVKESFGILNSKAFFKYIKDVVSDNTVYAAVGYIPDAQWSTYTSLPADSDTTFYGGLLDSDYDYSDGVFYSQNAISLHKLYPNGVSNVVPRVDWVKGETYNSYPTVEKSYALVKEYTSGYTTLKAYKCLHSPRTPSYYAPSSVSYEAFKTPDGYIWKYSHTISNADAQKFLTRDWMPVPQRIQTDEYDTLETDATDYERYVAQINSVPGKVHSLQIDSDVLYEYCTANSIPLNGVETQLIGLDFDNNEPSSTFKFTFKYENNKFVTNVIDSGAGYAGSIRLSTDSDYATNQLVTNGLKAYSAPDGGFGFDVVKDLNAYNIMVTVKNIPDLNERALYNGTGYNIVSLIADPIDKKTNTISKQEFYVACNSFDVVGLNQFNIGDEIKPSPLDDGRRGIVVGFEGSRVYYTSPLPNREYDAFVTNESVTNGVTTSVIATTYNREVYFNSGDYLIADYKKDVVYRSNDQVESFNFIIEF